MNRAPFSFYEFFAGGGMARLGLGDGWACAFANDFDPLKAATYRANFADAAEHFHEGDVWKLAPADLSGQGDLAWASSPCQDFSLAGARAGLAGGRSSAFFGFWRLIEGLAAEARAPRTIVVENVGGLLTSHGGRDFAALGEALAAQGYCFGALEVDAAAFLPQSRPRVFVIATREPPPASLVGTSPFHTRAVQAAAAGLPQTLADRWIWWRTSRPAPRNTDLAALLEPDAAVAWHSPERTDARRLVAAGDRGGGGRPGADPPAHPPGSGPVDGPAGDLQPAGGCHLGPACGRRWRCRARGALAGPGNPRTAAKRRRRCQSSVRSG